MVFVIVAIATVVALLHLFLKFRSLKGNMVDLMALSQGALFIHLHARTAWLQHGYFGSLKLFDFSGLHISKAKQVVKKHEKHTHSAAQAMSKWPVEWKNPLVVAAVADGHYIEATMAFVESFTNMGFANNEVFLICIDVDCVDELKKRDVKTHIHQSAHCKTLRCRISEAKISLILRLLNSGITVFFFDLDVYFLSSPLIVIPDANTHIMVQNNEDTYTPNNNMNFGAFLVRPTNETKLMFSTMLMRYRNDSSVWDQKLFNDVWLELNTTVDLHLNFFDNRMFPLFNLDWWKVDRSLMVAIHMTCVEGSLNKYTMAKQLFGPFQTPSYYINHSTVTVIYHETYSEPQIFNLLIIARYIAKQTGRWIRLSGWDWANVMSLLNADAMSADGVGLVEEVYWTSARIFHPTLTPVACALSITSPDDIDGLAHTIPCGEAHDIIIDVITADALKGSLSLAPSGEELDRLYSYICPFWRARHFCLRTCTNVHF